jgi:intracellular septation protein
VAAALTLLFNDDSFIKWKPTLINGLFALVFAGSLFSQRSLAERLFAKQIDCPPSVWKKMTLSWVFFFVVCAAANYYVAFIYHVDSSDLNAEQYQHWQTVAADDQLFADLIYQKPLEALEAEQKLMLATLSSTERQEEYLRIIHQSRWVDFKLFGLLALTIAFVLGQGFFIAKYFDQDEKPKVEPGDNLRNTL